MGDHLITDPDAMTWVDVETTGLDPSREYLMEVGLMVTDARLNPLAWTSTLVGIGGVNTIMAVRAESDPYVRDMHDRSGLWVEQIDAAAMGRLPDLGDAQAHLLDWWGRTLGSARPPMCGSSVTFDRSWLAAHMPDLHDRFHYREVNVSTVKELCRRWNKKAFDKAPLKYEKHRAIPDLRESLDELAHYRKHFIKH